MLLIFDRDQSALRNPKNPIPRHGAGGAGHVCFSAGEAGIDGWRAHLLRLGLALEAEHAWPGGARSLYLRDPAGNSVEVGEPRMRRP